MHVHETDQVLSAPFKVSNQERIQLIVRYEFICHQMILVDLINLLNLLHQPSSTGEMSVEYNNTHDTLFDIFDIDAKQLMIIFKWEGDAP